MLHGHEKCIDILHSSAELSYISMWLNISQQRCTIHLSRESLSLIFLLALRIRGTMPSFSIHCGCSLSKCCCKSFDCQWKTKEECWFSNSQQSARYMIEIKQIGALSPALSPMKCWTLFTWPEFKILNIFNSGHFRLVLLKSSPIYHAMAGRKNLLKSTQVKPWPDHWSIGSTKCSFRN